MASAESLAHDFWSALCQHDIGRAASLLADGAVFHLAGMRPASGGESVEAYLAGMGAEIGSHLEKIALYQEMIIVERIGRVAGDPAGKQRAIVSLARVQDGRITSWQDFLDLTARAELADAPMSSVRGAGEPKRASAR